MKSLFLPKYEPNVVMISPCTVPHCRAEILSNFGSNFAISIIHSRWICNLRTWSDLYLRSLLCIFCWASMFLRSFFRCRAEILTIFGWYFGRNDDFINSFWNLLTFRQQQRWSTLQKKGNSCSKNNASEERAKEHAGSTKNTQQQP